MARALTVKAQTGGKEYYGGTRILKYSEFKSRWEEENRRKEKYGLEYGLLKFKRKSYSLEDWDEKLSSLIRTVDLIGYNKEEEMIYILLPATQPKFIPEVESRIKSVFDSNLERVK